MQTSESIEHIATALSKAQAELQNPPKNKVNPHFNSAYVDLSDGLDTIRKSLGKHGLSFIQATNAVDNFIILHTRLMHLSGQWIESTYPVCGMDKHQAMGSALTYARRYALFAMVGVAGEDDDDGNAAQEATPKTAPKRQPEKKQMAPGLNPEDSDKVLKAMKMTLDMVADMEELKRWATDESNQATKSQLLPAHQKEILDAFTAKKAALVKNG